MARETKAERETRLESERLLREKVARDSWPQRLMVVLSQAADLEWEVRPYADMYFDVSVPDGKALVPFFYGEGADSVLEDLEYDLRQEMRSREEEHRKYQLRQGALAKLTAEEREELGL